MTSKRGRLVSLGESKKDAREKERRKSSETGSGKPLRQRLNCSLVWCWLQLTHSTEYVLPAYARFGLAGVGVCFVPRYPARARLQQAPASFVALDTRPQALGKRTYGTHGLHGKHGYMVAMVSNWLIGGVSASIGTCGYPLSVRRPPAVPGRSWLNSGRSRTL